MYKAKAYSAASATSPLASSIIPRRDTTEHDVQIEILFCGICHSDLHTVRNEWSSIMPAVYPCVPGHEIVGRSSRATWRASAVWLIRTIPAPIARMAWNNCAQTRPSPSTPRTNTWVA